LPVRVLVVDDAVVIRRILTDVLSQDPDIEVVGTAANGKIALAKIEQLRPDIITLDVEMPEMDGLATLQALRERDWTIPVVMFSTLTRHGASTTLEALSSGATDYVTKPSNVACTTEAIAQIQAELVPRLKVLGGRPGEAAASARGAVSPVMRARTGRRINAVVIGASTGGPVALETLLSSLDAPLPVPVLVVQHMPPMFTAMLAERLDRKGLSTVVEAREAMVPAAGTVYIAPGGRHMRVASTLTGVEIQLHDDPPVNSCRPAVDPLFQSSAEAWGPNQLGIVLTGMGHDGLQGCRALAAVNAEIFAQDAASSVVWGMPGSVIEAGLATKILPLDAIAPSIAERARPSAVAAARLT
jgi:two-component system chemotaxis response regulator CheB